jgi:hypothetical protein
MIKATRYVTFDGDEYESQSAAVNHLEALRGDIICKLARALVDCNGKYTAMIEVLDKRLMDYRILTTIAADMALKDSNE